MNEHPIPEKKKKALALFKKLEKNLFDNKKVTEKLNIILVKGLHLDINKKDNELQGHLKKMRERAALLRARWLKMLAILLQREREEEEIEELEEKEKKDLKDNWEQYENEVKLAEETTKSVNVYLLSLSRWFKYDSSSLAPAPIRLTTPTLDFDALSPQDKNNFLKTLKDVSANTDKDDFLFSLKPVDLEKGLFQIQVEFPNKILQFFEDSAKFAADNLEKGVKNVADNIQKGAKEIDDTLRKGVQNFKKLTSFFPGVACTLPPCGHPALAKRMHEIGREEGLEVVVSKEDSMKFTPAQNAYANRLSGLTSEKLKEDINGQDRARAPQKNWPPKPTPPGSGKEYL